MDKTEKIAKDACDYLFRVGKHIDAKVEFDPVGYLRGVIADAVAAEREACQRDVLMAVAAFMKTDASTADCEIVSRVANEALSAIRSRSSEGE